MHILTKNIVKVQYLFMHFKEIIVKVYICVMYVILINEVSAYQCMSGQSQNTIGLSCLFDQLLWPDVHSLIHRQIFVVFRLVRLGPYYSLLRLGD